MFDYHMHSGFSADCEVPMEEMAEASINKGLTEICFTEHVDYDYPDDTIHFDFDKNTYADRLNEFRQKYQNKLTIKKGIEIGFQPHVLDQYEVLMDEERFDFVIGSLHTVDRKALHYREVFQDRTINEAFETYYQELLYCVEHFKKYHVLGHIDLIKRYTNKQPSRNFHEYLEQIFKTIIPDGKGIELNTSGTRYGLPHNMPSEDILRLYKDCGGEMITIGSDAHQTKDIAHQFSDSLDLLKKVGFKYIATFEEGKPKFHSIDSLEF